MFNSRMLVNEDLVEEIYFSDHEEILLYIMRFYSSVDDAGLSLCEREQTSTRPSSERAFTPGGSLHADRWQSEAQCGRTLA
ncbi:hypothetical protein KOW79_016036 [Hemibagrus wyckioides]|uniref:Uncharacterized protein n=1 Tax=Hemibagrus wyckioides TaxID=337641 RepID=A0A9D3NC34_9TELE|nr:hypothetical protein KOW79_016036 [Hemibagrus wyckioides]